MGNNSNQHIPDKNTDDSKIRLVKVRDDYIDYILRIDQHVEWNKEENRPYFVVELNNRTYCIPLSSQLPANESEGMGCLFTRDENNKPIGRLLIRNAVQIPKEHYFPFVSDDPIIKVETEWLIKNESKIIENLQRTIRWQSAPYHLSDNDFNSVQNCVDFLKNEKALFIYNLRGEIPPKNTSIRDYILDSFENKNKILPEESRLDTNTLQNFSNIYMHLIDLTDEEDHQTVSQEEANNSENIIHQVETPEVRQSQINGTTPNTSNNKKSQKKQQHQNDENVYSQEPSAETLLRASKKNAVESAINALNTITKNFDLLERNALFKEARSLYYSLVINSFNMSVPGPINEKDDEMTQRANLSNNKTKFFNTQLNELINNPKARSNSGINCDDMPSLFDILDKYTRECMQKSNSYYTSTKDTRAYSAYMRTYEKIDKLKKILYEVKRPLDSEPLEKALEEKGFFDKFNETVESVYRCNNTLDTFTKLDDLMNKYDNAIDKVNLKVKKKSSSGRKDAQKTLKNNHNQAQKWVNDFKNVTCSHLYDGIHSSRVSDFYLQSQLFSLSLQINTFMKNLTSAAEQYNLYKPKPIAIVENIKVTGVSNESNGPYPPNNKITKTKINNQSKNNASPDLTQTNKQQPKPK